MNLNKLAQIITRKEGKKVNLTIAQVKEVLKITLRELKIMSLEQVADLLRKQK